MLGSEVDVLLGTMVAVKVGDGVNVGVGGTSEAPEQLERSIAVKINKVLFFMNAAVSVKSFQTGIVIFIFPLADFTLLCHLSLRRAAGESARGLRSTL